MVYEPRAGEGAKANILTKMIYPRRNVEDATAQSTVILISEKDINIKVQRCYTFHVEDDEIFGMICSVPKSQKRELITVIKT
jgi:hypothetical protein